MKLSSLFTLIFLPALIISCGRASDDTTVMDRSKQEKQEVTMSAEEAETRRLDDLEAQSQENQKKIAEEKELAIRLLPEIPRRKVALETIPKSLSTTEKAWVGMLSASTGKEHLSSGEKLFNDWDGRALVHERLDKGHMNKTECILMELYNDHTGFWFECSDGYDGMKVMENTNLMTGKRTTLGLRFQWLITGKEMKIRLEKDLEFIYLSKEGWRYCRTKCVNLQLPPDHRESYFRSADYFPEYDYQLPIPTEWVFHDSHTFGKPKEYKIPEMH